MEKIGYVYLTTNLVNGKQYVGQHLATEFDKRYKGSGTALKHALEKYGWDNFKCEVLCWCCTQDELNYREQYEIVFHSTFSPNGYNLKHGGLNGKWIDESRKRASMAQKKRFENPEEREKSRLGHVGQVAWNKGVQPTKEQVEKQKVTLNKYWDDEENRIKASIAQKKRFENPEERKKCQIAHQCNKILQFTKDGEFVKEWCSLKEIKRVLGFDLKSISNCCKNKPNYKSAYNCLWKYKTND